jgi:hypothetical protein
MQTNTPESSNKRALTSPEDSVCKKLLTEIEDCILLTEINSNSTMADNNDTSQKDNDQVSQTPCKCDCGTFDTILKTIHEELAAIRVQNSKIELQMKLINDYREEVKTVQTSVKFLNDKYEDHLKIVNDLTLQNAALKKEVNIQKKENAMLTEQMKDHAKRIDEIDQYGRRMNVLFDKIPENEDEDTNDLVVKVCKKLGVDLTPSEIQISHRLGLGTSEENKPRAIIARFSSVGIANTIMYKSREQFKQQNNNKQHQDIVYAREHLTSERAKLLKECITRKAKHQIHSCWTYKHDIYVKFAKTDKKGLKIKSVKDLH